MDKVLLYPLIWTLISKIEGDAEINPPGVKETRKTIEIPPNVAKRLNTRGPILFKCCRVVYNKETNRLELPEEEVVGKDFLRCKEDEESDENEEEEEKSNFIGKIIYTAREGVVGWDVFLWYIHSGFPFSRKPTFPNSNWTRNVDVLPVNRCLLFIDWYIK